MKKHGFIPFPKLPPERRIATAAVILCQIQHKGPVNTDRDKCPGNIPAVFHLLIKTGMDHEKDRAAGHPAVRMAPDAEPVKPGLQDFQLFRNIRRRDYRRLFAVKILIQTLFCGTESRLFRGSQYRCGHGFQMGGEPWIALSIVQIVRNPFANERQLQIRLLKAGIHHRTGDQIIQK